MEKAAELDTVNEQLHTQTSKRESTEHKLREYHEQLQQLNAELVTAEESLEQQLAEHQRLEESFRQRTQGIITSICSSSRR